MFYRGSDSYKTKAESRRMMLDFLKAMTKWSDAKKLKFLDSQIGPCMYASQNARYDRINLLNKFRPAEEGGCIEVTTFTDYQAEDYPEITGPAIAVVKGGMDCDGSQYEGNVTLVNASGTRAEAMRRVEEHIDRELDYADGPMHFDIISPSEAKHITRTSRDLALEAFEDGHSHIISSARFESND